MQNDQFIPVKPPGNHRGKDFSESSHIFRVFHKNKLRIPVSEAYHTLFEFYDPRNGSGIGHTAIDKVCFDHSVVKFNAGMHGFNIGNFRHALQHVCQMAKYIFLILRGGITYIGKSSESRDISKILVFSKASHIIRVRFPVYDLFCCSDRVIFRNTQR